MAEPVCEVASLVSDACEGEPTEHEVVITTLLGREDHVITGNVIACDRHIVLLRKTKTVVYFR